MCCGTTSFIPPEGAKARMFDQTNAQLTLRHHCCPHFVTIYILQGHYQAGIPHSIFTPHVCCFTVDVYSPCVDWSISSNCWYFYIFFYKWPDDFDKCLDSIQADTTCISLLVQKKRCHIKLQQGVFLALTSGGPKGGASGGHGHPCVICYY